MRSRFPALVILLLAAVSTGCTSFATVRPARVHPGGSLTFQGSISSSPGEDAGWFWSLDCGSGCDRPIPGVDVLYTHGWAGGHSLGVGINGPVPYVEGYTQLNGDTARAFGVGGRVGIPVFGWSNHQLYARYDLRLADGRRVLLNPGVFLHVGNSPNGQNPGHFLGLVQAVGLERRGERTTTIPALALVIGRGERESYGLREGPFTTAFGVLSMSVTFHRPRSGRVD